MKSTTNVVMTTNKNGTTRPVTIAEVYHTILPNALQHALVEAMKDYQEVFLEMEIGLNSEMEDIEKYILTSPVYLTEAPADTEAKILMSTKTLRMGIIDLITGCMDELPDIDSALRHEVSGYCHFSMDGHETCENY